MHPVEHIDGILNNGIPEKKTQEDSRRNIDASKGKEHVTNKGAMEPKVSGLVEAYRRYDGEGWGREVRGQDNDEMYEEVDTLDSVYYLLAGPSLPGWQRPTTPAQQCLIQVQIVPHVRPSRTLTSCTPSTRATTSTRTAGTNPSTRPGSPSSPPGTSYLSPRPDYTTC